MKAEASPGRDAIAVLSYGLLPAVAVLRLILARKWALLCLEHFVLLLDVLNGAYAAIFFTRVRFRVPFDYLLLIVAVMAAARFGATSDSTEA